MPLPTVSCVITAHNYERYVGAAIRSALEQTYPAELVEVVVVDDGSTDGTAAAVREAAEAAPDRVRLVSQPNAGLAGATDRALREASGELLGILDADDVWLPDKLSRQVELLRRSPDVGLVYADMEIVDADGRTLHPSFFRHNSVTPRRGRLLPELLRVNFTTNSTLMFRASLRDAFAPIPHASPYADYWIVARIAAVAALDFVDAPLSQYRLHSSNMGFGTSGERLLEERRRELRFMRALLATDVLDRLPPDALVAAAADFEQRAQAIVEDGGSIFTETVVVTDSDRSAAVDAVAAARDAVARDRADVAQRLFVRAWLLDPWNRHARAGLARAAAPITEAERLAERGDTDGARRLLDAALAAPNATPADRARALGDLAVLDYGAGELASAARAAADAVSIDAAQLPAIEVLAWCARGRGDLVEATDWHRRAVEVDGDDAGAHRALGACLLERGDLPAARAALERALDLDPADATTRTLLGRTDALDSARMSAPTRKVMILVDYFHPSVGGSERLAEEAGVALERLGWRVAVVTRKLPNRSTLVHRGLTISEVEGDVARQLAELVRSHEPDAILVFSDPRAWPYLGALTLARPRPRVVAVPCINADGYARLQADGAWRAQYAQLAASADALVYSSISGFDARLCEELGVGGTYVPNAAPRADADGDFRGAFGFVVDRPLLLAVGNLFPEKNHIGLLDALRDASGDWQLAIIGRPWPDYPDVAAEVARRASIDERVKLIPGAPPEVVDTAMATADLLLLPSLAEATPLVLLEAMRERLPWIATPACGSAHDHAGGLIEPLERFPAAISFLLGDRHARATLGQAGHAHWRAAYTWDVIGPRYSALLSGSGVDALVAPRDALENTEHVRRSFVDSLVCSP